MDTCIIGIGAKLGEYLVEPAIRHALYPFRFNSNVKALREEETNLKAAQASVECEVEREERNTRRVDEEVDRWRTEVVDVLNEVATLNEKIDVNLDGRCPNWSCHYWLSKNAAKKTSKMSELIEKRREISQFAHLISLPGLSVPKNFRLFEATLKAQNQIIKALKDDNSKMVGLYGTGGVGKTTLAISTGILLLRKNVFDKVVVVVISQNPDLKKVQNQLAEALELKLEEEDTEKRAKRLHLRITSDNKSKILVIIDDVWKKHDLKFELGLPIDDDDVDDNGCKILLTTRRQQVCDLMGCKSQVPLGILKPEEGLYLLKTYAGICDDDDPTLISVSNEVASECKGLPLAIAAIGSAMRGKDVDEWKLVSRKLITAKLIDVDDIDVDVYACLKLSYDYLKDEEAKLCFMLCSLFPEEHDISLEDLVRYGLGLGWYRDVKTIEEARSLLRATIKGLKASSLLLETGDEGFIKMHDVIRDVAIWIRSKEKTFMSQASIGLTEWPKDEEVEQYRAIFLVKNKIELLPSGLLYPNLYILILGDDEIENDNRLVVPDEFFNGMMALKIVIIIGRKLSLRSLRYLTDLQVLQLIDCYVTDMASLTNLTLLQILCIKKSVCDEIPEDLGDALSELKLLELVGNDQRSISPTTIRKFSRLQEFYGWINNFEVEGTSSEDRMENVEYLPRGFAFSKLQRYDIRNINASLNKPANTLEIRNINKTSLVIFSALYQNLQCLCLEEVKGCKNIVPSIDPDGLNELTSLELSNCADLECILGDLQEHEGSQDFTMLSSLKTIRLTGLPKLQWIWKPPAQHVNLNILTKLEVLCCHNLTHIFTLSQFRNLEQLECLKVADCRGLKCIARFDGNERETEDIVLRKLRSSDFKIERETLPNFIKFCAEHLDSTWRPRPLRVLYDLG